MFERILVPLDGSKAAEGVLPYVKKLAFKTGGESVFLHVIDPQVSLNSTVYSDFMRRPTQQAKREAQEYLRGIAEDLEAVREPVTVRTVIGPTANRILSTAESQHASLIVISARGRGQDDTWAYGSIADRILHHSRVPVLLVKPRSDLEEGHPILQSLVVPLDGSNVAETVLPLAGNLADRLGVGVHLFQAAPTLNQALSVLGWGVTEEQPLPDVDPVQDGKAYLDRVAGTLTDRGTWADGTVVVGAAVPSILDFARAKDGALIVMCAAGSRGINARWRVGSVAERLLRHSDMPVLLVPPRVAPHLRREMGHLAGAGVGAPVSALR
jgi:nucleotide-binding universal stress UspA family protein